MSQDFFEFDEMYQQHFAFTPGEEKSIADDLVQAAHTMLAHARMVKTNSLWVAGFGLHKPGIITKFFEERKTTAPGDDALESVTNLCDCLFAAHGALNALRREEALGCAVVFSWPAGEYRLVDIEAYSEVGETLFRHRILHDGSRRHVLQEELPDRFRCITTAYIQAVQAVLQGRDNPGMSEDDLPF